jgi:predicted nucleic acid-binding protein
VIICDTGPLVAAALYKDPDYRRCVDLFAGLHLASRPMVIPAPVIAEVGYLLEGELVLRLKHFSSGHWLMATSSLRI